MDAGVIDAGGVERASSMRLVGSKIPVGISHLGRIPSTPRLHVRPQQRAETLFKSLPFWAADVLPEFLLIATKSSKKHREGPKGFRRYMVEREERARNSKKGEQNS